MALHPSGFCVLVVSAEPSIRQTRLLLLEEAGHSPRVVESCAQAKEIMQLAQFHLVILDHTLSKDDRIDLIQSMRKMGSTTRVLLLHKSGADCGADFQLDSREGPDALISAIDSLVKHPSATSQAASLGYEIEGQSHLNLKICRGEVKARVRRRTIE